MQTRPSFERARVSTAVSIATAATLVAGCGGGGFKGTIGGGGLAPIVVDTNFAPLAVLTAEQVDRILAVAVNATNDPSLSIAITDRLGNPLRLYQRGISAALGAPNPDIRDAGLTPAQLRRINYAHAMARASAFLSHSEAPLTSRTGQFLSTFHTPAIFDTQSYLFDPPHAYSDPAGYPALSVPIQVTAGVKFTSQADLWQIDASNRGTFFARDPGLAAGPRAAPFENLPDNTSLTSPETVYAPGAAIPIQANPDGTGPSPGLGPIPGGVPLYVRTRAAAAGLKPGEQRRLVGAIGVYIQRPDGRPNAELADAVAFEASRAIDPDSLLAANQVGMGGVHDGPESFTFAPIEVLPPEGAVYLVGLLLPYIYQSTPTGIVFQSQSQLANPVISQADLDDQILTLDQIAGGLFDTDGTQEPEGYVVAPQSSLQPGGLTAAEVDTIVQACRDASRDTHAAIRLPAEVACRMWISVCDADGVLLGVFRQRDATLFSYEISLTKARNAVYFSNPDSRIVNDPVVAGPLAGRHPLTGFRANKDSTTGEFLPVVDANGNLIAANGTIVNVFPRSVLESTGVAVTARTLGFLTQPFYPPGIDGSPDQGPLHYLVQKNRHPASYELEGFRPTNAQDANQTPQPQTSSGIIFFPGAAPLYRDGVLVGGIGVSGDGVSQDDIVTALGIARAEQGFTSDEGQTFPPIGFDLEPDASILSSSFAFENVAIPYMKFPQNPGG